MGRASFVTPVYFFSSIRAGSGKATLIANFAVFLNSLGHKVAIIDLDSSAPLKLKNAFPQSVTLQEYEDLRQVLTATDSRYQKTFYFTATQQISYIPAMSLSSPEQLFQDAALRDFFLQTRATFDTLIVNFPSGDKFSLHASDLLSQNHFWHGSPPNSIIVSLTEANSLIKLDGITRKAPALSFQLRENTLIVFNRVPGSLEEQKLSDTALNTSEVNSLFKLRNSFFIGHNEEFPHQKNVSAPIVLKTDSLIHQSISRLNRLLTKSGLNPDSDVPPSDTDFLPCLDGSLLEKLSPYLEKIQTAAAAKFLVNPAEIQIFLEESKGLYRIRVRLSGQQQKILRVSEKIESADNLPFVVRLSPKNFSFSDHSNRPRRIVPIIREKISNLYVKPVYRFDDRFSKGLKFEIAKKLSFEPQKNLFPSPIIFRHCHQIPEIPSLSHILGFIKKSYKKFPFVFHPSFFSIPGVTHFFIPPEFSIESDDSCLFTNQAFLSLSLRTRNKITHDFGYIPAYQLNDAEIVINCNVPDLFSRNQGLLINNSFEKLAERKKAIIFTSQIRFSPSFATTTIDFVKPFFWLRDSLPVGASNEIIPAILPLFDPEQKKQSSTLGRKKDRGTWFEKTFRSLLCDFNPIERMPLDLRHRVQGEFVQHVPNPKFLFNSFGVESRLNIKFSSESRKTGPQIPSLFQHFFAKPAVSLIEPSLKNHPGYFKQEAVLIDHHLPVRPANESGFFREVDTRKVWRSSQIDFKTFFKSSFSEKISNSPNTEVTLGNTKGFKQIFLPPARDFKKVGFRLPVNSGNHHWDILQVSLISKRDRDYRRLPNEKSYQANYLADSMLSKRSFPAVNSGMLTLKKYVSDDLNRGLKKSGIKKIKTEMLFSRNLMTPSLKTLDDLKVPDNLETRRIKKNHQFAEKTEIPFKTSFFGGCMFFVPSPLPEFKYETPVVYTVPYHYYKPSIFSFKFSSLIAEIYEPNLNPIDQKDTLGVSKRGYEYFLEPYDVKLPALVPTRAKKFDPPTLEKLTEKSTREKIIELKTEIERIFCRTFSFTNTVSKLPLKAESTKVKTAGNLPFFKPLIDVGNLSLPRKFDFRVPPPDCLKEIYNNLLRQLNWDFAKDLSFYFRSFTIKPIVFSVVHAPSKLHFKDRIFFARRILHGPEKLGLPIRRDCFEILNPKLKDLFKLARQTSRKFMEVNTKNGS